MNFNPLKSVTPAAPNSNIMGNVTNAFSNIWIILGIVVVVAVLCYVYYKKIGYYVTLGIDNLTEVIKGRQTVSAEFGTAGNMDAPGDLVATLKPMDQMGSMNRIDEGSPPHPNLPSVPNRPSGMPGAQSGQPGTFLSGILPHPNFSTGGKQVFNVSRNIYTYHDAAAVCAALDSDLATYEQVKDAYSQGADWCNYGWVKGQMAVYPTQKDTYEKLQKGHPQYHNACGRPGINGGYFDNPELLFGVNCFGVRPAKNAMDELNNSEVSLPPTTDELEFEKQVQKFRDQLDDTTVLPFNKNSWSG
jgi:hypothetical protein